MVFAFPPWSPAQRARPAPLRDAQGIMAAKERVTSRESRWGGARGSTGRLMAARRSRSLRLEIAATPPGREGRPGRRPRRRPAPSSHLLRGGGRGDVREREDEHLITVIGHLVRAGTGKVSLETRLGARRGRPRLHGTDSRRVLRALFRQTLYNPEVFPPAPIGPTCSRAPPSGDSSAPGLALTLADLVREDVEARRRFFAATAMGETSPRGSPPGSASPWPRIAPRSSQGRPARVHPADLTPGKPS